MPAWINMIYNAICEIDGGTDTGLIRMFRVEYAKEYHQLQKMGIQLDVAFVRQYIQDKKRQ